MEVTVHFVKKHACRGAAVTVMCKNAVIDYHGRNMGVAGMLSKSSFTYIKICRKGTGNFGTDPPSQFVECAMALDADLIWRETTADICAIVK
jgi:hypothetical protein